MKMMSLHLARSVLSQVQYSLHLCSSVMVSMIVRKHRGLSRG